MPVKLLCLSFLVCGGLVHRYCHMFALDIIFVTFFTEHLNNVIVSCQVSSQIDFCATIALLILTYISFAFTKLLHRLRGVQWALIRSCCPFRSARLFSLRSRLFTLCWILVSTWYCLIMVALAAIDFYMNILCYGIWMTYNITNALNSTNVSFSSLLICLPFNNVPSLQFFNFHFVVLWWLILQFLVLWYMNLVTQLRLKKNFRYCNKLPGQWSC